MNKNTKRNARHAHKELGSFKPGVQTESKTKNLRMVVLHNEGANGTKDSITRFEPIRTDRNCYQRFARRDSR